MAMTLGELRDLLNELPQEEETTPVIVKNENNEIMGVFGVNCYRTPSSSSVSIQVQWQMKGK